MAGYGKGGGDFTQKLWQMNRNHAETRHMLLVLAEQIIACHSPFARFLEFSTHAVQQHDAAVFFIAASVLRHSIKPNSAVCRTALIRMTKDTQSCEWRRLNLYEILRNAVIRTFFSEQTALRQSNRIYV